MELRVRRCSWLNITKVSLDIVECDLAIAPIVGIYQWTPRIERPVDPRVVEYDFVGSLPQQVSSVFMFRVDQDDMCVVDLVHNDGAVYLLMQRLIKGRVVAERVNSPSTFVVS